MLLCLQMGNIKSLCCDTQKNEETSHLSVDTSEYGTCSDQNLVYNVVLPCRINITPQLEQSKTEQSAYIKEEYCSTEFERIRSFMIQNPEGEKDFKECIWSCIPWSAPGGKSGSTFFKTTNDQFILKQMTKTELQSFLSIADSYFAYIEESYNFKRPTLLSTILGIYRIVYKDSSSNSNSKYDFMVMQNLFHKRDIRQRFDLKGSTRNRLVDIDDPENSEHVLLDENLRRISCEQPLRISEKSKQILNQAIDFDSKFLSSISVMDYSLLVGIDKDKKDLIVGIIDYVRPFTWDKRLEQVVKSVGSAEMPTIVEPGLYRTRFCDAMDKYFESVPES